MGKTNPKPQAKERCTFFGLILSTLNTQTRMKFTKAQKEILLTLENGDEVLNYSQRMRAIQPLIDMGIVYIQETKDSNGHTDSVRVALVD